MNIDDTCDEFCNLQTLIDEEIREVAWGVRGS